MAGVGYTSSSKPMNAPKNSGGLNNTAGLLSVGDNEASDLLNVDFTKFGSILKRKGSTALNTSFVVENAGCTGLYMQKNMRYAGLQLYTIIKAESINDDLLSFLKAIDIDWELVFVRRDLSIDDWLEIEVEKNSVNLKGYLSSKFEVLGFFDVNNIARTAIINQLNFKTVIRMSELLDRIKSQRLELTGANPDSEPLKKAEIIAAARLACAYYGVKQEIKMDKSIKIEEVQQFEAELIRL